MENDFENVKVSVRSLLTSSKTPLSIEQLQKDYKDLEGSYLPHRRLGFASVVQLLQKMNDVLIVSILVSIVIFYSGLIYSIQLILIFIKFFSYLRIQIIYLLYLLLLVTKPVT